MYNGVSRFAFLKPREMFRTIVLTGFAAVLVATTIALAPPARAQIGNIFSDPAPRPPSNIPHGNAPSDDEEEVPELPQGGCCRRPIVRCRRGRAHPRGCGAIAAFGAAARHHRHSAEYATSRRGAPPPNQGVAVAPPGPNALPDCRPGNASPRRAAIAADAAARRRGCLRTAGAENRQQEGKLFRPRQDHRTHHQLR